MAVASWSAGRAVRILLVTFRASPDERVTIETPAQQRASTGGVTVNVNVANGNPQSIIAAIKQALQRRSRPLLNGRREGRINAHCFTTQTARP